MDSLTEGKKAASALDVFAGGGEMGELMRSHDWSNTPLGPVENWSPTLRTLVSTILASRFPQCIFWGDDYIQIYNNAMMVIYGAYHPHALGQPLRETWPEVWDNQLKPMCQGIRDTGEAVFAEDLLFQVFRFGDLEETYFTVCYSPVWDEAGKLSGILCITTETTQQVIGQRRLTMLRELATASSGAKTLQSACLAAADTLNPYDIPFALFYQVNSQGDKAELVASSGLSADSAAAPPTISLSSNDSEWLLAEVFRSREPQLMTDVGDRFGVLSVEPWPESPHSALILPILSSNKEIVECLLVAGINPRLPFNSEYRSFLELVAQQIESSIATAQSYEQERKRAEALAELDRAKTAFFNNISHEFRTPLMLILNPLEQVIAQTQGSLQPEQREQLAIVQRNAMRLQKLVNTLLDFSRIEAGRIQAVYEPTDLAAFTAELVSVFRSAIETAGLQLIVDCSLRSELVYVDRQMWEKIVLNLISNAFKFTFTGEIAVSLHSIAGTVELKVRDTGTGIKSEELPRIFERFHRIRGVQARSHEGSGIGLALVQELVHLHGGTIKVESVFGKGTTFTVTLPTGSSHLPSEQISTERIMSLTLLGATSYIQEAQQWQKHENLWHWSRHEVAAPISPHEFSAGLILLVDDNADMRGYLKRLLQQHWQVQAVANGADALQAIAEQTPDLVLTDVMMPEMDGFQLLSALRADPKTKGLPIILLSARAGEKAAIEGLQAGADDYLIKPFSAQELIARVDSHLQMARLRNILSTNRLKDEFLATVTHELHAPLVAILGWTRLLRSNQLDRVTALGALNTIERNATNQAKLIEDLLDISTILSGKVHIDRQPVNLTSTVAEVMQTMLSDAQVETRLIAPLQEDICICGDLIRLQQVFSKLLHNAIKFTPKGGSIEVQVNAVESWAIIQISNNGIGMSADFLPHVFDRFSQEEVPSRHSPGGLGLGLAIARQLVELHGGTIEAASEGIGRGATFTVKLPLI
ncbi:MAG: ATP-binding protein [Aulosira sp. ZfuCHP01]|nr:ATP-binding protein [Aulosira sp. ZfuVER01]MDZ7999447.1 ATP-binding protein [Aulosira sp. DedVER01a]MDZ8054774.1 ATP-binding protein [Aulosira sp. ZfuCHP01]